MSKSSAIFCLSVATFLAVFARTAPAGEATTPSPLRNPDTQVVLEVRLLTLSQEVLQRAAIDLAPVSEPTNTPAAALRMAFLNSRQVQQLIAEAQGDRSSNLVQTPRLTLLDGQVGTIDTTHSNFFLTGITIERQQEKCLVHPKNEPVKLGLSVSARPAVSADRKFIRLALKIRHVELVSAAVPLMPVELRIPNEKQTQKGQDRSAMTLYLQQPTFNSLGVDQTVSVPDGGTVLFAGKKTIEGRCEYGPPVLSQIPYINRLVKTVGYSRETGALVVMVTPRILEAAAPAAVKQASFTTPVPPARKEPVCTSPARQINLVAELLKAYDQACAAGRNDEAQRLARAALILNPRCFQGR